MTDSGRPPVYTQAFWAKASPFRQSGPERIHLLEHHLADVGACFEALVAQPTIRRRLAWTAGLNDLDDATAARLAALAALHDIGKVNIGFQTQVWQPEDLPTGQRKPHRLGHTVDLAPVLDNYGDTETSDWFFPALGFEEILQWDDCDGMTACGMFVAALSHHGLPLQLEGARQPNPRAWKPFGDLNPRDCVERIGRLVRQWFPEAFALGAPTLPSAPAFQHFFLGLCTLADWIGSNEEFFHYQDQPEDDYIKTAREQAKRVISTVGLDIVEQRAAFDARSPGLDFADLFDIPGTPPPNAIQQRAALDTSLDEKLVIIESETGSGKTEAALWRFARMYEQGLVDGLYFALPTRSAASQLHRRVTDFVKRLFPDGDGPETLLAVPGYLRNQTRAGDATGKLLQNYEVWWDDHGHDARRWAAESAKRYLAAQIAVGTVDQAMLATMQVKHAHMRAACLARNLLVIDEVHASDPYMGVILESLLNTHIGAGGYALLMSATLGSVARRRWLFRGRHGADDNLPLDTAIKTPYPAVSALAGSDKNVVESVVAAGDNDREKTVRIEALQAMSDFDQVAEQALQAARAGAKVLVIRNTVNYAINTQKALEQAATSDEQNLLFNCRGVLTLHTGRFAADDRKLLDEAVEAQLGKNRSAGGGNYGGNIVVGTQTLEQSLDIDADLLITDLCPVDVLLQRIGRLHRHQRADRPDGYQSPACLALTPPGDDLSPLLSSGQRANGLGPHGYVYEDLRILEATRRLIVEHPQWLIPEMNRLLVEQATHPDALDKITEELGEDWKAHAIAVLGGKIGDMQVARNAIIRRDKSFFEDNRDVLFPTDNEEKIRTRLGDEGVAVKLEPPPPSPFDATMPIDQLTLPVRWLGGPGSEESVTPEETNGGFDFQMGNRRFRYNRLGLQRL